MLLAEGVGRSAENTSRLVLFILFSPRGCWLRVFMYASYNNQKTGAPHPLSLGGVSPGAERSHHYHDECAI